MVMAQSIRRDLVANFTGQGWAALMGIAFVPVYIRYLGVEAYGLLGFFVVLQVWSAQVDAVVAPIVGREMARLRVGATDAWSARNLLRGAEFIVGASALMVAGVAWAGSGWLAAHWLRIETLPLPTVTMAIAIMGFIVSLRSIEGLYRGAALGYGRQVTANVVLAVMATIRGVGAVCVLAWVAPTIIAFFIWQASVSAVGGIVLLRVAYAKLPPSASAGFSLAALAQHRRFAAGMIAITVLAFLLTQVDKLLLSRLLGLAEYGVYFLSTIVAGAIFVIVQPVTQTFLPRFSSLVAQNESAALARSYHLGAQLVTVLVAPAALLLALNPTALLTLWTHDPSLAEKAGQIVPALCLGSMLNSFMWIPYQMQLAHGHTRTATYVNIVAVALVVPAIWYVAPHYGAAGAAWVWCALNAGYVVVGINVMYSHMLRAERARWYLHDICLPVVAAAACLLVGRAGTPAVHGWQLAGWLAGSLLAASLAALAAAPDLRHAARRELVRQPPLGARRSSGLQP